LVILLAGFGIFNVLTMTVLSKIKEIAILRSIGYRRRDISAIFSLARGVIARSVRSSVCVCGGLMVIGRSHIPLRVRGLLYADYFPSPPIGTIIYGDLARDRRGRDRELCTRAPRRLALARSTLREPAARIRIKRLGRQWLSPEFLTPNEIKSFEKGLDEYRTSVPLFSPFCLSACSGGTELQRSIMKALLF